MSPVDDMFLSGSLDKTIRLWDLKSSNCQVFSAFLKFLENYFYFEGLMQLSSRPIAAFGIFFIFLLTVLVFYRFLDLPKVLFTQPGNYYSFHPQFFENL